MPNICNVMLFLVLVKHEKVTPYVVDEYVFVCVMMNALSIV